MSYASKCTATTKCDMRRKIRLFPLALSEEACGVPDDVSAAYIDWLGKKSPTGKNVLVFRVCPWCAEPFVAMDDQATETTLGPHIPTTTGTTPGVPGTDSDTPAPFDPPTEGFEPPAGEWTPEDEA